MTAVELLEKVAAESTVSDDVPVFAVGDTVRVHARIYEGDKQRIQVFAGTVIARDGTLLKSRGWESAAI